MGELIDYPYRRVPRQVVDKLVRTGYLQASKRHQTNLVMAAWDRFKQDVDRLLAERNDPSDRHENSDGAV
jgi:hypothetical protein